MTFAQSVSTCFSKYVTFNGRAVRSEYWWFYLFGLILGWGAGLVGALVLDASLKTYPGLIVNIALVLPSIAVGVRRLHDTGRSGWWLLLSLTCVGLIPLIIWLASAGEKAPNKYGSPA